MPWIEKGGWVGHMDGCSSVEHIVFVIVRIASHWSSIHVVLFFKTEIVESCLVCTRIVIMRQPMSRTVWYHKRRYSEVIEAVAIERQPISRVVLYHRHRHSKPVECMID